MTVNEYPAGVGLSAHIDTHSAFSGPILSLSLAGATVMEFRRGDERRSLALPPRSLLVMAGEARYAWAHYIPHRKSDVIGGQVGTLCLAPPGWRSSQDCTPHFSLKSGIQAAVSGFSSALTFKRASVGHVEV